MSCKTYLYDSSYKPLTSTSVKVIIQHRNGTQLGSSSNAPLDSPKWGADIKFSTGLFSYSVYSYDQGNKYTPASYSSLNGAEDGVLNVVMLPYPSAMSYKGAPPVTVYEVMSFIDSQEWSDTEKLAVRQTLRMATDPYIPATLSSEIDTKLSKLGINTNLVALDWPTAFSKGVKLIVDDAGYSELLVKLNEKYLAFEKQADPIVKMLVRKGTEVRFTEKQTVARRNTKISTDSGFRQQLLTEFFKRK